MVSFIFKLIYVAPTHSGGNESGEQGEQGGNSEVDPGGNSEGGEGEGGGEVIHIGDETPMYDNYPVATFRDNLSRFFASGLYVEYNYKVEDKTNGNGQFANAHVYAGIKNNIGFVKNEYTGYSAYFEFGDTSVIVHPYDMTAGDYDRTGTEWGYDVLDLDKNGAILYEVGTGMGMICLKIGQTHMISSKVLCSDTREEASTTALIEWVKYLCSVVNKKSLRMPKITAS